MRALVIGADGFAGRWLVRHLVESGDVVTAAVGPRFRSPLDGPRRVEQVDVRDGGSVSRIVRELQPETVFNLAGVSNREEREDVDAAVGVSIIGSLNVLLACAETPRPSRLVFVSTGYVYQPSPDPLTEESELGPDSIYASAKLAAERMLATLAPALGVEVVIARPFNHIGPGQSDSFLVPTVARKIAAVVLSGAPPVVSVADRTMMRDYSDVRDVVAAYRVLADRGAQGQAYNVASGTAVSVADLAHTMAAAIGLEVEVRSDDGHRRDGEPTVVAGDAGRIRSLGWQPRYSLPVTLDEVMRLTLARLSTQGARLTAS